MKCAVYIRVSTDKKEQETSLINQERYFYNIIAEKGWELHKFYIDVQSGTKANKRASFKEMIEDAKDKKFDIILSKELSRLARNGQLSYEIKEMAEQNNVHIITFDNAINTTVGNIHMSGLYAWVYDQESQRTSERIKASLNSKARKGEYLGSHAPYGYQVINKRLVIAENDTVNVIKDIFNWYVGGTGFDAIARRLSKKGIPTPATVAQKRNASKYWHGSTIKNILSNPHYTGILVQHRETSISVTSELRKQLPHSKYIIVPNAHPPLISNEQFDTVQYMINKRKKTNTSQKYHLFTNYLYCIDCGKSMWYRQNRKGYICGNYAKNGNLACSHHAIKETAIKKVILENIQSFSIFIKEPEIVLKLKQNDITQIEYSQSALIKLEEKIAAIKSKKRKYIDLLADNIISLDDYHDMMNAVKNDQIALEIEKSELNASVHPNNFSNELNAIRNILIKLKPINEVTSELLHHFVQRTDVDKEGVPTVQYRFNLFSSDLFLQYYLRTTLHMCRLWKHINRLYFFCLESTIFKNSKISGKG
ncbi:DNA invertase Pin-like site-specific DNA recombinase [Saliterribacillus persicus]|uniref:DNA invertase Pin-like site-specific DNA recombinase n=1 Tax=Saliterribacillus persicus TaxID=930114 RepID=A0A368XDQ4_9BACI|nr:DNA invertase Pin-like site-specific DNA recombinase [Saliterribacillus persicus]